MIKNLEQIEEFYMPEDFSYKTNPGISAFMRIKNEEEWIAPCLLAILDLLDEVVIVLNNCTDKTEEIVRYINSDKIKIFHYPFNIEYRGPAHSKISVNSLNHSAYYYNWCLSKTTKQWTMKWDGDNIATKSFEKIIKLCKENKFEAIKNTGIDLINLEYLGAQQQVSYEPRIFKLDGNCYYTQSGNSYTQQLHFVKPRKITQIDESSFLHMKYSKSNPYMHWPVEWNHMDHFKNINNRHKPIKKYDGNYPLILRKYLELNKNPFKLIDNFNYNPREECYL